jgi:hypothetical protein
MSSELHQWCRTETRHIGKKLCHGEGMYHFSSRISPWSWYYPILEYETLGLERARWGCLLTDPRLCNHERMCVLKSLIKIKPLSQGELSSKCGLRRNGPMSKSEKVLCSVSFAFQDLDYPRGIGKSFRIRITVAYVCILSIPRHCARCILNSIRGRISLDLDAIWQWTASPAIQTVDQEVRYHFPGNLKNTNPN